MTTTRRDFLRALAAGTGLVMVPKALDRFRWTARPSGILLRQNTVAEAVIHYHDGRRNIVALPIDERMEVMIPPLTGDIVSMDILVTSWSSWSTPRPYTNTIASVVVNA